MVSYVYPHFIHCSGDELWSRCAVHCLVIRLQILGSRRVHSGPKERTSLSADGLSEVSQVLNTSDSDARKRSGEEMHDGFVASLNMCWVKHGCPILSLWSHTGLEISGVVRNYVPCTSTPEVRYPVTSKPYTMYPKLETMYLVPQTGNHVPRTLDTMYFHQKFDNRWNSLNNV